MLTQPLEAVALRNLRYIIHSPVSTRDRHNVEISRDILYARIPDPEADGDEVFPEFWLLEEVAKLSLSCG